MTTQDTMEAEAIHIVGIGASAGGITALQSLFRALRPAPQLCLVVVQHLKSGEPTHLRRLVERWTALPVLDPGDGDEPRANCVYVASPDHQLTVEAGRFRTAPIDGGRRPGIDTIDSFFESLARDRGAGAIAVVLSGAGSDGMAGAVCVKRAGGVVLVQDALTAMHDSMPRAVIAAGAADYILPPEGIAAQLVACAAPGYVPPEAPVSWTAEVTRTLDQIIGLVRLQAGFDLSGYKMAPLVWRIQQRMSARRVASFQDYEALLRDDAAELESLVRGIPIHVTEFFRDSDAWQSLSQDVLESLVRGDKPIRAWTPACATGEEAYSVAMLLTEHLEAVGRAPDFQVFATDAYPEILARASRGTFSEKAVERVSPERRARFMYSADGTWRIKRSLREKMVFAPQDLLTDPPFSELDLVTCRNLLIYLEPNAIARVVYLLHSSLRLGGYLFLGRGEEISARQRGFEPVSSRLHIYRKVGPASGIQIRMPSRPEKLRNATAVHASAHRAAVEHFALPSLLIDDDFNILRIYGDTERYLRLPAGQPTHCLLDLLPRESAPIIVQALKEAFAERRSVTVTGLRDRDRGEVSSSMRLTPLQTGEDGGQPRALVSFLQHQPAAVDATDVSGDAADAARARSGTEWSEVVRASNEELEASREELQALNEELKTANEQLNLANAHLNEANEQLEDKIAALEMQRRVLSSGGVVTLFLDQELKVHWFTPGVAELFPLRTGDIGRRITDLVRNFDDNRFIADIRAVMQTSQPSDAEVKASDGRWFVRRIRPYLADDNVATGVAITFGDITALKDAEAELRRNQASLAGQNEAFRAAVNGAPLEASLAILVRTAIEQMGEDVRCAFFLTDATGNERHHVTGMPEGDLARDVDYRASWSFPIDTTSKIVGTLAMYHRQPRAPTQHDLDVASVLTRAAGIIISRHQVAEERVRAEEALRQSEESLAADLRDTTRLRDLAERLITEEDVEKIYDEILSVAIALMGSHAGTVQIYDQDTTSLVLLVTRNFERNMTDHFHRVDASSRTACGIALRTNARTFIDFDTDDSDEAAMHIAAGYRSAQATPLVSRKGAPLGMLNTHWQQAKHRPTERQLRFLDLLARQAADLIEQRQAEQAVRQSRQQLEAVLDSSTDGIDIIDRAWRTVYRNDAGRRLLRQQGLRPDDGIGTQFWTTYPALIGTPLEAAMRRTMEARTPACLAIAFPPTARTFEVRIHAVPGGGISVFYQDVTDREQVGQALRATEARLACALATMRGLCALNAVADRRNISALLESALDVVIAQHAADFAIIRRFDPATRTLAIVAQRGFAPGFLEDFAAVDASDASVVGRAFARRQPILIEDVAGALDEAPEQARDAGFRAMHATPLFSASGAPLGMVATYFRAPHRFTEHELHIAELFAQELARLLERGQQTPSAER